MSPLEELYREKKLEAALEPDPVRRAVALVVAEIFRPPSLASVLVP